MKIQYSGPMVPTILLFGAAAATTLLGCSDGDRSDSVADSASEPWEHAPSVSFNWAANCFINESGPACFVRNEEHDPGFPDFEGPVQEVIPLYTNTGIHSWWALMEDGTLLPEASALKGYTFVDIFHADTPCGLTDTGQVVCWDMAGNLVTEVEGASGWVSASVGFASQRGDLMGLDEESRVRYALEYPLPGGDRPTFNGLAVKFGQLTGNYACIIDTEDTLDCSGLREYNSIFEQVGLEKPVVPGVVGLTMGEEAVCVLLEDGGNQCWFLMKYRGISKSYVTDAPIVGITGGFDTQAVCAITDVGGRFCWDEDGELTVEE